MATMSAAAAAQGYRAPLARADFERMYAAGLPFVRIAYDDYAEYVRKHQPECWWPLKRVLDPFRPGQMAHAWDVEDELAAVQRDRFERGLPLLKARADRADLLDFEGAPANAAKRRRCDPKLEAAPAPAPEPAVRGANANEIVMGVLAHVGAMDADGEHLTVMGLSDVERLQLALKLQRAIEIVAAMPVADEPSADAPAA